MNNHQKTFLSNINSKLVKVGIIGVGYVGLPLAVLASQKGFTVYGFVRDDSKLASLKKGITDVDTVSKKDLKESLHTKKFIPKKLSPKALSEVDIIIVCVPTPITHSKKPDLSAISEVRDILKKVDLKNKLIINESTVAPGTTEELFGSLTKYGYVASSPERVDPGNKEKIVENISKVVGGKDEASLAIASAFYTAILNAPIVAVSSMATAEMTKMLENTYRAVNIALVNEIAIFSEALGIDVVEVIRAASSKWSFHPHYPGIGVGGHCIPVDPYYIVDLAVKHKTPLGVVSAALKRNEMMPTLVLKKLLAWYKPGMSVLLYGLTYKKDIGDIRESPSLVFCNLLKMHNIPFRVYDPYVSDEVLKKLSLQKGKKEQVDIFVIGTDHTLLSEDKKYFISHSTVVVDGRNALMKKFGSRVIGIGRSFA